VREKSDLTPQQRDERKNLNFVQFDRRVMRAHRELVRKSPLAAEILDIFIEHMGKNNAIVCSSKALEELTGKSRVTVSRAISVLRNDNWVQAVKIGNANAYVVNSAAFWSSWANGKAYSLFHASVLASASEQEQTLEQLKQVELKRMPIMYGKDERITLGYEELPPPDQQDLDLN
jgi:DNA-binding transcriptional ArsR family regulator|tara:strand:+ start:306 stop:830 length:525 start_codon:yes stop_codon:yes gene_type:complete